jgi:hypothetical protein
MNGELAAGKMPFASPMEQTAVAAKMRIKVSGPVRDQVEKAFHVVAGSRINPKRGH